MEDTALNLLKNTQEALHLNQKQFATYIGVSIKTMSNWMTGLRTCPIYVAEMAARLAEADLKALEDGERTTGMFRWCIISARGIDEWIQPFASKAEAVRFADADWNRLTKREKERYEKFMIGKMHVCYNPEFDGPFALYELEDGSVDGDVYECVKDYKE